jgi:hypothetical protein
MAEHIIFRCEVSIDDGIIHIKAESGEKLDLIDVMIARAYTAAIEKTTEALKGVSERGMR